MQRGIEITAVIEIERAIIGTLYCTYTARVAKVANAEQKGTKDRRDVELTIMATCAQDMSMWPP